MATLNVLINSRQAQRSLRSLQSQFERFQKQVVTTQKQVQRNTVGTAVKAAGSYFAVDQAREFVSYMSKLSDQYTLIDAKIKLVAKTQDTFIDARKQMLALSVETGTTLATNAQAFAKLGNSMKGAKQQDVIDYLGTVNRSLIVSGATAQEASGFMIQFAQAMGSGVVNGDELRTMNEANSYLMAKIADQFNTNIAGLKEMGAANILTTQMFAEALKEVAGAVERDYANIPVTIARAWNEVNQIWRESVMGGDAATEVTQDYVTVIRELAKTVEDNAPAIQNLFTGTIKSAGWLVQGVSIFETYIEGLAAAAAGAVRFQDVITQWPTEVRRQLQLVNDGYGSVAATQERIVKLSTDITKAEMKSPWTTIGKREQAEEIAGLKEKYKYQKEYLALLQEQQKKNAPPVVSSQLANDEISQLKKTQRRWISEWLDENSVAYKKTITDLGRELETLQSGDNLNIKNNKLDFNDDLREINREGMNGGDAWADLNKQVSTYKEQAAQAAASGNWKQQIAYLERAAGLINDMSTSAETRDVRKAEVEAARKIWEYQQRITRGGKSAVGDAAAPYKEAKEEYMKLLAAQKKGTIEEVTAAEKRKTKTAEMIELAKLLEGARKSGATDTAAELESTKATLKAYQEGNVLEIESLKDSALALEEKKEKIIDVEKGWIKYGDKVVTLQQAIQRELDATNKKLDRQKELVGTGSGYSSDTNAAAIEDGSPGRASGGSVRAGTEYRINEKGQEFFTPSSAGFVIPSHMSPSKGESTVNLNLSIGGSDPVSLQGTPFNIDKLKRAIDEKARFSA